MAEGVDMYNRGDGAGAVTESDQQQAAAQQAWRLSLRRPDRGDAPGAKSPSNSVQEYLKKWTATPVDVFYQQQHEMLDSFTEMDSIEDRGPMSADDKEKKENTAKHETLSIRISNITNMVLFAAKVYASYRSRSLAIIASTMNSFLDLLSSFILCFMDFSMKRPNPYKYPIGKNRMKPLGTLLVASLMANLGLQILLESGRRFLKGPPFSLSISLSLPPSPRPFASHPWTELQDHIDDGEGAWIMMTVTIIKLILAYAQDNFVGVITNVIGAFAAVLGAYYLWWIDPVGAIVIALYTIITWSVTVLNIVNSLVCRTASPGYLQKITYLCWNHHKDILQIDTVRAYTFGSHYFAEVDIVLPKQMPLQQAHGIGESLQNKLESLPEIERAFVRPKHSNDV